MAETKNAPVKTRPCPLCQKMSDPAYFPFCSKRCADVDLGRWLGGAYAIPTQERPAEPLGEGSGEES